MTPPPSSGVMREGSPIATLMLAHLGTALNRTLVLPMVIVYPTSRCNSRCVSCDWWRSSGSDDLTLAELDELAESLRSLGTRLVVFSGGEPLLRSDLFAAARSFRGRGMKLHLLTSGVLLERCASRVALEFSRVVVSLDATSEARYQEVRGIAALTAVERGVARLQRLQPEIPITARATLHKLNFRELPDLIAHARAMGLDGISFLPADLSSSAFGRRRGAAVAPLALDIDEVEELERVIDRTIADHREDFESGFVAESPSKLRRIAAYYRALSGGGEFPPVACNAPYTSVVVEADGSVRPCFFQPAIASIRVAPLESIVRNHLAAFRRALDVTADSTCRRCVCSMKTGWRNVPWR